MKISVLIPSFKRPDMLREALQSVAAQSRQDLVGEVIVSENSDARSSGRVAAEFPGLPVRHVNRSSPLRPENHFRQIVTEAVHPWVALIGDDDMWGRYHLEEAARLLSLHADAVASFAQCATVSSSSRQIDGGYRPLLAGLQAPAAQAFTDHLKWTAADVLVNGLIMTPLNMWTMVGRRTDIISAMAFYDEEELGHDSDRFMIWRLSRQGPLIIGREVGLFYRRHAGASCEGMLLEDAPHHSRMAGIYTRRMLAEAGEMGLDPRAEWTTALSHIDPAAQAAYFALATSGALEAAMDVLGPPAGHLDTVKLKKSARRFLPPVLWDWLSRHRRLGTYRDAFRAADATE